MDDINQWLKFRIPPLKLALAEHSLRSRCAIAKC
jgi:hypothetical protein